MQAGRSYMAHGSPNGNLSESVHHECDRVLNVATATPPGKENPLPVQAVVTSSVNALRRSTPVDRSSLPGRLRARCCKFTLSSKIVWRVGESSVVQEHALRNRETLDVQTLESRKNVFCF